MQLVGLNQYEARKYSDKYVVDAQKLFAKCFNGREFPLENWQWQFEENPCLRERITTLWDENKLIALTAITAKYAFVNGSRQIIGLSGTTMADADYFGVAIQLQDECLAKQNIDIGLIYGFPNKNAFVLATKFWGFNYIADICAWTKVPCATQVKKNVKEIESLSREHADLYLNLVKKHDFIVARDEKYLDWRFNRKPGVDYKKAEYCDSNAVQGYVVYDTYQEREELHYQIIDIVAVNEHAFKALINFVVNKAHSAKADVVKLWLTSELYEQYLQELGFEYGYQPFRLCVWNNHIDVKKCYLTMSDSDVF